MTTWPCHPANMSERIPEKVITLVIAGICERLKSPAQIMEINQTPNDDVDTYSYEGKKFKFFYPVSHKMTRYSDFCVALQKNEKTKKLCQNESCRRGLKALFSDTGDGAEMLRCHLGLINFAQRIEVAGHPLAVCSGGKFVIHGEYDKIRENFSKLSKSISLPPNEEKSILDLVTSIQERNETEFKSEFENEMSILQELTNHYLNTNRGREEISCRNKIVEVMSGTYNDPENFKKRLEESLTVLKEFFPVEYWAMFLSSQPDDSVLPLFVQVGFENEEIQGVHFNWRKAGLSEREKNDIKEISRGQTPAEDFQKVIERGFRGKGKEKFASALYILPITESHQGILVAGPWQNTSQVDLLNSGLGGNSFLNNIGRFFLTRAITQQALLASKKKDQDRDLMVAITAHSIRGNLHQLWNLMEIVQSRGRNPKYSEQVDRCMMGMEQVIREMKGIVERTVDDPGPAISTKITKSDMHWESNINLSALINNVAQRLNAKARDKQIIINIADEIEELPLIECDPYLIDLVFNNLVDNAIKYSSPDKEIRIYRVECDQDNVIIAIQDYGWGIAPEDFEHLFELGFRSDAPKKLVRHGAGLGCYQANIFVKLHEGNITCTSRPKFFNAPMNQYVVEFRIRLPVKVKR